MDKAPFDESELKSYRHKLEMPLYVTMVIMNILIVLAVIVFGILGALGQGPLAGELGDRISELVLGVSGDESNALAYVIVVVLIPFVLIASVYFVYAQYRARSVRITEKNFPEIYAVIEEYSQRLGLKKVPKVYLTQENGTLNAFSTFILRRQYVVMLADLFEVAYREHHDMESIKFILAHEMAHIRLRHATYSYQISILFANYIPIISTALSRAREYSCDRVAQHLVGCSGIEPMLALIVGKHLYKKVDIEDYVEHCLETRGFFVFLYNLLSTHPIMPKRVQALLKDQGSGRLFF